MNMQHFKTLDQGYNTEANKASEQTIYLDVNNWSFVLIGFY